MSRAKSTSTWCKVTSFSSKFIVNSHFFPFFDIYLRILGHFTLLTGLQYQKNRTTQSGSDDTESWYTSYERLWDADDKRERAGDIASLFQSAMLEILSFFRVGRHFYHVFIRWQECFSRAIWMATGITCHRKVSQIVFLLNLNLFLVGVILTCYIGARRHWDLVSVIIFNFLDFNRPAIITARELIWIYIWIWSGIPCRMGSQMPWTVSGLLFGQEILQR